MRGIINCAVYSNGHRTENIELKDIGRVLSKEGQFVWVGLYEPDEELMNELRKEFALHELAIEDAHRAHQRPKIEAYNDTYFVVLRTAQMNEEQAEINFGETHFFLGQNFIISIRHSSSLAYADVRTRCESTPKLLSKGPGFVLYAIMDFIVDQYFPIIDRLEQELEELEDKIFKEKFKRETPAHIYRLKCKLNEVHRAVLPLIDICNQLMRFDSELIHEDIRPYFRDIYDHTIRINEMANNDKEQLTSALEANFSMTSIYQNEVSKKIAGWAAIIGVPTMLAGIYGMNFENMPELHWHYGYPIVLLLIVFLCSILYWLFKRSDWL
ncbi:MAG: magnesium/cobalt transporter CorA [Bacteroidota bacterium]|nr:magnesium/cobalt transporter CorA [Bacteroidota bacterium]